RRPSACQRHENLAGAARTPATSNAKTAAAALIGELPDSSGLLIPISGRHTSGAGGGPEEASFSSAIRRRVRTSGCVAELRLRRASCLARLGLSRGRECGGEVLSAG